MPRLAALTVSVFAAASLSIAAHAGERAAAVQGSTQASAVSAQQRDGAVRPRPRARIRVTPQYPYRTFHSFYPLPYDIEYPGPNAFRHCDFRLAQEFRPSGTVIVPRERCYWVQRR